MHLPSFGCFFLGTKILQVMGSWSRKTPVNSHRSQHRKTASKDAPFYRGVGLTWRFGAKPPGGKVRFSLGKKKDGFLRPRRTFGNFGNFFSRAKWFGKTKTSVSQRILPKTFGSTHKNSRVANIYLSLP